MVVSQSVILQLRPVFQLGFFAGIRIDVAFHGRKIFPAEKPYTNHTYLIEDHQGDPHHRLIHHIWGGSQNSCDNKIYEYGILTVLIEKSDVYDANLGQKYHKQWHLEDDAKGKEQSYCK